MLKRCILAENRKLHASPIWAMFFVLPILSATYGTFNYLQNLEILTDGWYSLWTQHTLFYSMLFFLYKIQTFSLRFLLNKCLSFHYSKLSYLYEIQTISFLFLLNGVCHKMNFFLL